MTPNDEARRAGAEAAATELVDRLYPIAKREEKIYAVAWQIDQHAQAAVALALKQAATVAGGWTGKVNTVENAGVVSNVCTAIHDEILALSPDYALVAGQCAEARAKACEEAARLIRRMAPGYWLAESMVGDVCNAVKDLAVLPPRMVVVSVEDLLHGTDDCGCGIGEDKHHAAIARLREAKP